MTAPLATEPAKAAFVEYYIPLDHIHPDPVQPRIHPDAELAGSIASQGVLQPIRVEKLEGTNVPEIECPDCGVLYAELAAEGGHYMIQDGERRYRGSLAAGRGNILARIVPPVSEGDRLVTQVTSNTGKPLTPVEEAIAYKRILESKEISQAELAKLVGRPKSVIGDRIRMIELDPVWLELIESGKLQVAHAPILSTWSVVPAKYQAKAAEKLLEDYRAKRFTDHGDKIPVDELPRLLRVAFREYICPMSHCPGYRGPTVKVKHEYDGGHETFAADMTIWRPFAKRYESKRRKQNQANAGSSQRQHRDVTLEKLPASVPKRKTSEFYLTAHKGETLVYETDTGWVDAFGGDPETFLSLVDPAKLTKIYSQYSSGIATTDVAAVTTARAVIEKRLRKELEPRLAEIKRFLAHSSAHRIQGPGCRELVKATADEYDAPYPMVAWALGIEGFALSFDRSARHRDEIEIPPLTLEQAEQLATAYVAQQAGALKVPSRDDLESKSWRKVKRTPFRLPEPGKVSKTAAKKAARANGEQVGDPSRAPLADAKPSKASRAAGALFDSVAAGYREEARA